jgi:MoxR-like ATPase
MRSVSINNHQQERRKNMDPRNKLQAIRTELNNSFFERNEEIDSLLIAVLAKQHALLLGPPGTAKSALANAVAAAIEADLFEWLLTAFSTPEELFGPISFKAMEMDVYKRITSGKLPEAKLAFLDEIFKANSAILNALLALINERKFHNNGGATKCPLVSLFGASNELPGGDNKKKATELDALFDRFALRHMVPYIKDDDNLVSLLSDDADPGQKVLTTLTSEELAELQDGVSNVEVPLEIVKLIVNIKKKLQDDGIIASDRRWRQMKSIIRANAFLNGRDVVNEDDLLILAHCLWTVPDQYSMVRKTVGAVASPLTSEAVAILDVARIMHAEIHNLDPNDDEFTDDANKIRKDLVQQRNKLQKQIDKSASVSAKAETCLDEIVALCTDVKNRVDAAYE